MEMLPLLFREKSLCPSFESRGIVFGQGKGCWFFFPFSVPEKPLQSIVLWADLFEGCLKERAKKKFIIMTWNYQGLAKKGTL